MYRLREGGSLKEVLIKWFKQGGGGGGGGANRHL